MVVFILGVVNSKFKDLKMNRIDLSKLTSDQAYALIPSDRSDTSQSEGESKTEYYMKEGEEIAIVSVVGVHVKSDWNSEDELSLKRNVVSN
ncbi:hypothetical protein FQA39_LY14051 [Lamprigera yunnana]|nr:hypothetical protein FQA39_LY14051 [Lamprigera yunnana]